LHNSGILRVTTERWTTPEGASVQESGVVPDVLLELGRDLTVEELVNTAISAAG
jgi:C-terminal processing protease CtpA/Prc